MQSVNFGIEGTKKDYENIEGLKFLSACHWAPNTTYRKYVVVPKIV
jgi:hypothetical protein